MEPAAQRVTDNTSLETFEAILYDPAGGGGETGDGDILLQYHTVNQVDPENGYATAGIQNAARDDGVLYTYWNLAAPGGAPLAAGRAILFTTLVNRLNAGSGVPVPGAALTLAQNQPNPFNPRTRIAFTLATPGAVAHSRVRPGRAPGAAAGRRPVRGRRARGQLAGRR